MVVNAVGQQIQLIESNQQLKDLLQQVKPGDQLQGKIVELLPENRAIIQFKGINLISQLPGSQVPVQKGNVLLVQVQSSSGNSVSNSQVSGSVQTDSAPVSNTSQQLNLKLLEILSSKGVPGSATAEANGENVRLNTPVQLFRLAETALKDARLPINTQNLNIAVSLSKAGMPVTPETLNQVIRTTQVMIQSEESLSVVANGTQARQSLMQNLNQLQQQLQTAAQFTTDPSVRVQLQNVARQVNQVFNQTQNLPLPEVSVADAEIVNSTINSDAVSAKSTSPASSQSDVPFVTYTDSKNVQVQSLRQLNTALESASAVIQSDSKQTVQTLQQLLPQVENLFAGKAVVLPSGLNVSTLAENGSTGVEGFQNQNIVSIKSIAPVVGAVEARAVETNPALAAKTADQIGRFDFSGKLPGQTLDKTAAVLTDFNPPAAPIKPGTVSRVSQTSHSASVQGQITTLGMIQRETTAAIAYQINQLPTSSTANVQNFNLELNAVLTQFKSLIMQSGSTPLQAVQAQLNLQGVKIETPVLQQQMLATVEHIQNAFQADPVTQAPMQQEQVLSMLSGSGVETPGILLSQVSRQTVLEAVVFLQARQLPVTRATIETVAGRIHTNSNLVQQVNQVIAGGKETVQLFPSNQTLSQSVQNLDQFFQSMTVRPEFAETTAVQLQQSVRANGFHVEADLINTLKNFQKNESGIPVEQAPKGIEGNNLKSELMKLQREISEIIKGDSPIAKGNTHLQNLHDNVSRSLQTLHTLQLSAQPTSAQDVTTLHVPVWVGGQLEGGQLSVYWKKGSEHKLSEKDPVNVALVLNTRGLGEVRVGLQVLKNSCSVQFYLPDDESTRLVQSESINLSEAFSDRTPFKLQGMAFHSTAEKLDSDKVAMDEIDETTLSGLNLKA